MRLRAKRVISKRAVSKFKWMTLSFWFIIASYMVVAQYVDLSEWDAYDDSMQQEFDRGRITEFADDDNFCHSYIVIPGAPLLHSSVLFIAYFFWLVYLFLGISIISDTFMGAIEVITSQSRSVTYEDEHGIERTATISVWNPTIANLTLMALGSSAPEILLACIETISDLGKAPGELGPSTIVGSAAFNLLVISAVWVVSVPTGTTKKIQDTFVFGVTATTSLLAYVWIYIVLEVWSEGEIEIAEAVITFIFFPIFIICAYVADKINEKRRSTAEKNKEIKKRSLPISDFYHILNAQSSDSAKIHNKDGFKKENNLLKSLFKENFGTSQLTKESLEKIQNHFQPTDQIQQRIHFRRMVGKVFTGTNRREVKKNEIIFNELKQANNEQLEALNPIVGFRCLHYSVSEGIGKIKVKIINKLASQNKITGTFVSSIFKC